MFTYIKSKLSKFFGINSTSLFEYKRINISNISYSEDLKLVSYSRYKLGMNIKSKKEIFTSKVKNFFINKKIVGQSSNNDYNLVNTYIDYVTEKIKEIKYNIFLQGGIVDNRNISDLKNYNIDNVNPNSILLFLKGLLSKKQYSFFGDQEYKAFKKAIKNENYINLIKLLPTTINKDKRYVLEKFINLIFLINEKLPKIKYQDLFYEFSECLFGRKLEKNESNILFSLLEGMVVCNYFHMVKPDHFFRSQLFALKTKTIDDSSNFTVYKRSFFLHDHTC